MRIIVLRTFFLSLLAVLTVNLFFCQVINGQYYLSLSEQNRIRVLPIPALRGRIFDRHGVALAENKPSFDVSVVPEDFDRNKAGLLSDILRLEKKKVLEALSDATQPPFSPVPVKRDAGMEEVFRLEERRPEMDGVHVEIRGKRHYPLGTAAGHLTGYIGLITEGEYRTGDRTRFLLTDFIGRSGIEGAYDQELRGWHGGKQIEVNSRGRVLRTLSERQPVFGKDIYLTVDSHFELALSDLIKDKRAVIGVMDLATDEILALVSTPGYNPNAFVTPSRLKERMKYLTSSDRPMINQAVEAGFPLGSVFKLVVALGALEEGIITSSSTVTCHGHYQLKGGKRAFKCWREGGHGIMDLTSAIEQSCNVYFYDVGKRLGVERMARYARELGLGDTWDAELGRMFPGLIPDEAWKKKNVGEKWYQGETISFAIGQSYLLVSPLQVLRLVATIASGGVVAEPHLVKDESRESPGDEGSKKKRAKIDPAHLETVREAMREVVRSSAGTGQLARVDGIQIAGKTGTAQDPPDEAHSWFAGFAPFEHPEIAVVVFVEHGGSGGQVSGPMAKSVFEIWKAWYFEEGRHV